MPEVTFKNGGTYDLFCHKCQKKFKGKVFRQRIRWVTRRPCCGQMKSLGYIMPPDELHKSGLIERGTIDPRKQQEKEEKQKQWQEEMKEREVYDKRREIFTRSKYL